MKYYNPLCTFSLLTAYQILSTDFYFKMALTTVWIRVTIQHLQRKERGAVLCYWLPDCSDHIVIISFQMVDHIWRLVCSSLLYLFFFSFRFVFLLCRRSDSERFYRLKTRPHDYHSVLGFDHIFDHKQNRSTRRQECTRV